MTATIVTTSSTVTTTKYEYFSCSSVTDALTLLVWKGDEIDFCRNSASALNTAVDSCLGNSVDTLLTCESEFGLFTVRAESNSELNETASFAACIEKASVVQSILETYALSKLGYSLEETGAGDLSCLGMGLLNLPNNVQAWF